MSSLLSAAALGCSFTARSADDYRDDTAALLATKNAEITACYEQLLVEHPEARGTVTLRFKVQEETGTIAAIVVDTARTDAPDGLIGCVRQNVAGLVLRPADARDGEATFAWRFEPAVATEGAGA